MEEFDDSKVADFKEAFGLFDKDKDGQISKAELKAVFQALGQKPTDQEISDMVREVDSTKKGTINFNDFVNMMARRKRDPDDEDDVQQAFRLFDQDKDGFISPAELRAVLASLGEKVSDSELADIIRDADKDKDGKLNFQEFVGMMNRPR